MRAKKHPRSREILISESAWEEMTCLFAPSLGLGLNTSVGAFSFDVTHSMFVSRMIKHTRGKVIVFPGTSYSKKQVLHRNIAAYRYSTQNYLGLNDALTLIDEVKHPEQDLEPKSMRNY
ncbi:fimbria/pilus outer membrane usher protein [Escherichia coli]